MRTENTIYYFSTVKLFETSGLFSKQCLDEKFRFI